MRLYSQTQAALVSLLVLISPASAQTRYRRRRQVIPGVVIGAFVLMALLILLAVYERRRRQRRAVSLLTTMLDRPHAPPMGTQYAPHLAGKQEYTGPGGEFGYGQTPYQGPPPFQGYPNSTEQYAPPPGPPPPPPPPTYGQNPAGPNWIGKPSQAEAPNFPVPAHTKV